MTPAYLQDGQADELINRFKKEQASEEGGWRYGLYLSTIYEQLQDYGFRPPRTGQVPRRPPPGCFRF